MLKREDSLFENKEEKSIAEVLASWEAVNDFDREKNLNWLAAILFINTLLLLFTLLAGEFILAPILLGLTLIALGLNRLPGQKNQTIISTKGFKKGNTLFPWSQLKSFSVIQETAQDVLVLETHSRFFSHIFITLPENSQNEIRAILTSYLPEKNYSYSIFEILIEILGIKVREIINIISKLFSNKKDQSKSILSKRKSEDFVKDE